MNLSQSNPKSWQTEKKTYLEPAHVEQKLKEGEEGKVDVATATIVEKLSAHQTRQEERVDGKSNDLKTSKKKRKGCS